MHDRPELNLHTDLPMFQEAVNFTTSQTGFNARLVEKDYFCTVLLAYLTDHAGAQLVFKGGTCLAKVHAGFYRLSEDLDFTIPLPVDASRTDRRTAVAAAKKAITHITKYLPLFGVSKPLTGANNSTQYNGTVAYQSPITGQSESILIEISVREPLIMPAVTSLAKTLLLNPVNGQAAVSDLTLNCICLAEAMAEKLRAAMSRRDVAIRDFYDLSYAAEHLALDPRDPHLIELIQRKLAVPGNPPVDLSEDRLTDLRRQLNTRLRTVLQDRAFLQFNLEAAFRLVTTVAEQLS